MKTTLISAIVILQGLNIFSQKELIEYIPTNQDYVITINGASIFSKIPQAELQLLDFYKNGIEVFRNQILDTENSEHSYHIEKEDFGINLLLMGEEFGLDNSRSSYYISNIADSLSYSGYIISQLNHDKFINSITSVISKNAFDSSVTTKNGYQYYMSNSKSISWNNDVVIILNHHQDFYYDYYPVEEIYEQGEEGNYYENYQDRLLDQEKQRKKKEQKKIETTLEHFFNGDPNLSLKHNNNYQHSIEKPFDIAYYINGLGNSSYSALYAFMYGKGGIDSYMNLYADNYSYLLLNFEKDKVTIESNQHVSDKFLERTKQINNAKFNKDLFKYIDGSELIGITGVAVNPEASYDLLTESYTEIMRSTLGEEGAIGMEIFFTLLDEEEIFDLIKGNMIFAVTDIKDFDVSYTTYEYDEDFNSTEITKTKKESLPEFVFAASIGNKNLTDKFILLLEKSKMAYKKDGYYKYVPYRSYYSNENSGNMEIFFAIKNEVLLITNDFELISKQLEKGVEKHNQLDKTILSLTKSNNMFAYWNGNKTLEKLNHSFFQGITNFDKVNVAAQSTFGNVIATGVHQNGNEFTSNITLSMKETNSNSLISVLQFANKMYLLNK